MKIIAILLLFCCSVLADDKIISQSPDGHFQAYAFGEDEWLSSFTIRDAHTKKTVADSDSFSLEQAYSFNTAEAIWSPDSSMVAISYCINKHGLYAYTVLQFSKNHFVEIALPEDAIPVKWTDKNELICSVRKDATFRFDSKSHTFKERQAQQGAAANP